LITESAKPETKLKHPPKPEPKPRSPRPVRREIAIISRWLHIYLSMASFGVVLFFAVTGLTLNHPDWFAGREKTDQRHGQAPAALLHSTSPDGADKLGLVELFRNREHIQGALSDFRVDDQQIAVSFRAPGYTADAFIDRTTGKYDLTEVRNGFIAVINDLHKGRDAGKVWSVVIDISAIFLTLVSLTGLILIWFIYKRRTAGLILATITSLICIVLYRLFVQ
jgi:uncharacterized protein